MVLEMALTNYQSNLLFLKRGREEMTTPGYGAFDDESAAMLFSNGGNGNSPPKRRRESPELAMNDINPFLLPCQPLPSQMSTIPQYEMKNLGQLQNLHPFPSPVSTGLQLAFEEPIMYQNVNQWNPMPLQINQYVDDEIGQLILVQGEQLRRKLADKQQKHCISLLTAVEQSAAKTIRQKETELDRTTRLMFELEKRLVRMKAESAAWQAKAMAEHSKALALHTQLEQANATSSAQENCYDETQAEDAQSAHIDPDRQEDTKWICRACQKRAVSVVILPCRHLCFCEECNAQRIVQTCPICHCAIKGCLQVFLS